MPKIFRKLFILLSFLIFGIHAQMEMAPNGNEIYDDANDENPTAETLPSLCDSIVYCKGALLHTIQMANLFNNSKHFVDMSMTIDPGTVLMRFDELMKNTHEQPSKTDLKQFVKENFLNEAELEKWIPDDYEERPCFLTVVKDKQIKEFAGNIIKMWKVLGRKVTESVIMQPERHSLVPLPFGFIASGSVRYKEFYYWDSYWIVDGLLLCGMLDTVKGMIDNMVTLIIRYGFVPNGARKYYVERSQPPMLPYIVQRYYEETTDITWLATYIEYFETEMQFWINNRKIVLSTDDNEYELYIYRADSKLARPEVYYEDNIAAAYYKTDEEREKYFNDINTSAESGWDSSSRWIVDAQGGTEANLTFSKPTRIVPVDLNAFLYGGFRIMAKLYFDLENYSRQAFWTKKAKDLNVAIEKFFWNIEDGMWYDYDLDLKRQRKNFYASNLVPLWTKAYRQTPCKKAVQVKRIIKYLEKMRVLDFPVGIPVSLQNTGRQWDMPNVWPPLQSMIVFGLYDSEVPKAQKVAKKLAEKFLRSIIKGFKQSGAIYQRYDATKPGHPGPGGEYTTEKIFAWTNGVALQFVNKFYTSE